MPGRSVQRVSRGALPWAADRSSLPASVANLEQLAGTFGEQFEAAVLGEVARRIGAARRFGPRRYSDPRSNARSWR